MKAQSLETSVLSPRDSRLGRYHVANSQITARAGTPRTSILRHRCARRDVLLSVDHQSERRILRAIGEVPRRGVR
jgi:hypothetical protein